MMEHRFWIKAPNAENPWDYEIFFAGRNVDKQTGITKSLVYVEPVRFKQYDFSEEPIRDVLPMLQVGEKSLQSLMDALWINGIRPSKKLTEPIIQS